MTSNRWKLAALCLVLTAIHLNYWMWDDASIVLGLPSNLLYHVVWSFLLSGVMWRVMSGRPELAEEHTAHAETNVSEQSDR